MTSAPTYESPITPQPAALDGLSPAATLALGALAGLAVGYLYFTDHGRQLRERLEPTLDAWVRELSRLRESANKAHLAYTEGRDSLSAMTRATHSRRNA